MIDLKKEYGRIYRIVLDESAEITGQSNADRAWLYQIPCRYGHIYSHSETALGAYAAGRVMAGRLARLPGVRLHQRGDSEATVVFPHELLPAIAELLRARKRRRLTEEQRLAAAERLSSHKFGASDHAAQGENQTQGATPEGLEVPDIHPGPAA